MGADLIIQTIAVKIAVKNGNMQFPFDKLTFALLGRLSELPDVAVKEWVEEVWGISDDTQNMAEFRVLALETIQATMEILMDNPRDVTYIDFMGYRIFMTGGMSWGDSPTDSYDLFYKFNTLFPELEYLDEVLEKQ